MSVRFFVLLFLLDQLLSEYELSTEKSSFT